MTGATQRTSQAIASVLVSMGMLASPTKTIASTTTDLEAAEEELHDSQASLGETEASVQAIQARIDKLTEQIRQEQDKLGDNTRVLSHTIRSWYKSGYDPSLTTALLSADSVDELIANAQYAAISQSRLTQLVKDIRQAQDMLQEEYTTVSADKDEQEHLREELQKRVDEEQQTVDELEEQLSQEQAKEKYRSLEGSNATTFATESTDGWRTGVASAYGGWSDPSTGAVSSTATGAVCDDWSMGVAVPMAWPDYRSYFNRSVEISYNGQSVIAVVNDCGYMGGGARSLDLQPGVFKAFGFSDCDSWGLRQVSYRFL